MTTISKRWQEVIKIIFMIDLSNEFAVGIDIGGTKIRAAVVQNRKLVCEPVQISTPQGSDSIVEALLKLITNFQSKYSNTIQGVGIATAGVVDSSTGKVIGSTGNLPGWANLFHPGFD